MIFPKIIKPIYIKIPAPIIKKTILLLLPSTPAIELIINIGEATLTIKADIFLFVYSSKI